MSEPLIDHLSAAIGGLRMAMQSADPAAIEAAILQFGEALDAVKAVEDWQNNPALKAKLTELAADLDSSHMLARLLGDMTGQAQDALASRNPDAPQQLYKPGR